MRCFHCGMEIPNGVQKCPHCHNVPWIEDSNDRKVFAKWIIGIALILAIIGIILYIVKPFYSPLYPGHKDDTAAFVVLIMAGALLGGCILGLIGSWIEKK